MKKVNKLSRVFVVNSMTLPIYRFDVTGMIKTNYKFSIKMKYYCSISRELPFVCKVAKSLRKVAALKNTR